MTKALYATAARVRVLRVIARLNIGGPALHATLLHERLDRGRFHSTLVTGTEEPGEGNYLALHGREADVERIPGLGREIRPFADAGTLGRLVALMRRLRPHIVHTHTAKAGAVGRAAAILAGVPAIVHTYHGHVLRGYFPPARTAVYRAIERGLARRTDRLLAVTNRVRDELLALGVGEAAQYRAIPLGLDLAPLLAADARRGQLRAELGVGEAPLVGIVARLAPIKAHEVFLAAAARLLQALPSARFLIVGDGERRGELEARAATLGLADAVRFLGWRADLDRVYADLDVVALTSRNEGSPVALIEAMAAGVPVVSTDVGGVADVVRHGVTGLLAPMDDAGAVADYLLALLTEPERRHAMGRSGRETAAATYGAGRLVDDIEALYEDLVHTL